jgi:hypothetical protein
VIFWAVRDATSPVEHTVGVDAYARRYARSWLDNGGRDFRLVCALAGIDAAFIRDAWRAGRVDGELLRSADGRSENLLIGKGGKA